MQFVAAGAAGERVMSELRDMADELYLPSNGTEGYSFLEAMCGNCARDAEMNGTKPYDECGDDDYCEIIAASFRGQVKEWVIRDGEPTCTAFTDCGKPRRCDKTTDMFDVVA
jgi:hypothetical protein